MSAECRECGFDLAAGASCFVCGLVAELEAVMNERDLAVLTLAAFTPADQPLPVHHPEGND